MAGMTVIVPTTSSATLGTQRLCLEDAHPLASANTSPVVDGNSHGASAGLLVWGYRLNEKKKPVTHGNRLLQKSVSGAVQSSILISFEPELTVFFIDPSVAASGKG